MKTEKLFYGAEAYESPAVKSVKLGTRRMLCISDGNLYSNLYGDEGNAGGAIDEDNGGSLF